MSDTEVIESRMDGDPDGTITVSGGQGPDFDDFESVERSREQYVESREEKVEAAEEKPEVEGKAETEEREVADKEVEHSVEKDEEKIEIKFLKAKLGENEMELDPDTEIPVIVNGETEYRKLSDLRNHEAGQVAWDKKFQELDSEMQEREAELTEKEYELQEHIEQRDRLYNDLGKMHEMIQQGNAYEAIEFLVAQSGGNKYSFKRALMESLTPDFIRMADMTPEQIQAEQASEEAQFLREQMRSMQELQQQEVSQRESQAALEQMMGSRGVSREDFVSSYNELQELGEEGITEELVVNHAFMKPLIEKSEHLIGSLDSEAVNNDDLVVEMATIFAEDPSISDEEAVEMLKDVLGIEQKDRELLEKAQKTGQVKLAPENKGNYKYYGSEDPADNDHIESFNDYDDLY